MESDAFEEIWSPYRAELEHDYVSFSEVVRAVRRLYPSLDDDAVRDRVLAILRRALQLEEAQAGEWPQGVDGLATVWHDPADLIVDRARTEWIALNRDPLPGEILWLERPRTKAGPGELHSE